MARGKDTSQDPKRRPLTPQQNRWFSDYERDDLNPRKDHEDTFARKTGRR